MTTANNIGKLLGTVARFYVSYAIVNTAVQIGTNIWAKNTETGRICFKYYYAKKYKQFLTESQQKEPCHIMNVANAEHPRWYYSIVSHVYNQ